MINKEYGLDFIKYVFNNLSLEKKCKFKIIGNKDDIIALQHDNNQSFVYIEQNAFLDLLDILQDDIDNLEYDYKEELLCLEYEYRLGQQEQQNYFNSTRF